MAEHIPYFEIQFSFSCENQLNRAANMFLEDDLCWKFTVAPTNDSAYRHVLEIHDMPWASNVIRAGEIVEKACELKECK
jgi:hypothetical protein